MLRPFAIAVIAVAIADTAAAQAKAEPAPPTFKVIVHHDNPVTQLERKLLADVFLKRRTTWEDNEAVRPIDLGAESALRAQFVKVVLGRSVAQVRSYWQQRIFTGRELPPAEVPSEQEVIKFVNAHRGAVGYVSANADIGNAHVVDIKGP